MQHLDVLEWVWFINAFGEGTGGSYSFLFGDKDTYALAFGLANKVHYYTEVNIPPAGTLVLHCVAVLYRQQVRLCYTAWLYYTASRYACTTLCGCTILPAGTLVLHCVAVLCRQLVRLYYTAWLCYTQRECTAVFGCTACNVNVLHRGQHAASQYQNYITHLACAWLYYTRVTYTLAQHPCDPAPGCTTPV